MPFSSKDMKVDPRVAAASDWFDSHFPELVKMM